MHIKIKTVDDLKMLMQVNPILQNKGFPQEILYRVGEILEYKDLGRHGYVALFFTTLKLDMQDVLDELNFIFDKVCVPDEDFFVIDLKDKEHPMNVNKVWNSYDIILPYNQGKIYAVYSVKDEKD